MTEQKKSESSGSMKLSKTLIDDQPNKNGDLFPTSSLYEFDKSNSFIRHLLKFKPVDQSLPRIVHIPINPDKKKPFQGPACDAEVPQVKFEVKLMYMDRWGRVLFR